MRRKQANELIGMIQALLPDHTSIKSVHVSSQPDKVVVNVHAVKRPSVHFINLTVKV